MSFKQFVSDYLNKGTAPTHDRETKQKIQVANLFGFIGYSITFCLALSALIRADYMLAGVLFCASCLFFSSRLVLISQRLQQPYRVSGAMVTTSLMVLMVFLVYSGGVLGTGPLWIYVVPPVAFFFGGLRQGTRILGLFILSIGVLMFFPNDYLLATHYSFAFKSRLFYSFLTVCVLFAFYEYSRQKSYRYSQKMSRKYENQARIDQLSQLLNRRGIREILEAEFARQQRYAGALSLVMCDIDHFKQINDRHGHQVGDNVIKYLATIFKQALRQQDQTARWGGEEFLIVLPETDNQQALVLAEKLRAQIHDHTFSSDTQTFQISASFGIYQVKSGDSIDQAVNRADQALYEAKEQGRNQCMLSP